MIDNVEGISVAPAMRAGRGAISAPAVGA